MTVLQPLGTIAQVMMGQSPAGADCNKDGMGMPLLNGPTEFGSRSPIAAQWTTAPTRICQPGDVLICVRGSTTGRMNIADQPYCLGRGVAALRGKTVEESTYIFMALRNEMARLLSLTAGSVFPNLGTADLRGFGLPWPADATRAAIADTLGALDDKIESNRRVVAGATATLKSLAEATSDLPVVPLSSLVASSRQMIDPSTLRSGRVEHFSIPAFDLDGMPEISDPSTILSGKFAIEGPRVLVSRLNTRVPRVWYVAPNAGTGLASTEFLVLADPQRDSLAGVWLAVTGEHFTTELQRRATGTSGSHQRIRPADALSIGVPDTRLANESFLLEVETLLRLVHVARSESRTLATLRDALLPELLSGRLRVSEARAEV